MFEDLVADITHNRVEKIILSNSFIDEDAILDISVALVVNDSVVEIDLSNNNIGDESIKEFARMGLMLNKNIKKLNLSGNNIGFPGAMCLAEIIKTTAIEDINLSDNNIENQGIMAFARILKDSSHISSLNFWKNNITFKGAEAIAEAIKDNNSIKNLSISGNNIGYKGATALLSSWIFNPNIANLAFDMNIPVDRKEGWINFLCKQMFLENNPVHKYHYCKIIKKLAIKTKDKAIKDRADFLIKQHEQKCQEIIPDVSEVIIKKAYNCINEVDINIYNNISSYLDNDSGLSVVGSVLMHDS